MTGKLSEIDCSCTSSQASKHSPSPDDDTNGNQSQTDVESHDPHPRLAMREHEVAVGSSKVGGDKDEREKDVSRKPMVLVESTGRVAVRLARLGRD